MKTNKEKKATSYQQFKQGRVKGHRNWYIVLDSTKNYNLLFTSKLNINIPTDSLLESEMKKYTHVCLYIKK